MKEESKMQSKVKMWLLEKAITHEHILVGEGRGGGVKIKSKFHNKLGSRKNKKQKKKKNASLAILRGKILFCATFQ